MNLRYGVKEETYKTITGHEPVSLDREWFGQSHIDLVTAKNQEAAFQVLLKADDDFLLSISPSTCFEKRGLVESLRLAVIMEEACKNNIRCAMNIIGFVEDDDRLIKADILLDQENTIIEKYRIQPVWVELAVPDTLIAGVYSGRVEIYLHKGFEAERLTGAVSFKLDVRNVTLPSPAQYSFYLDLWQHNSNIARKHETALWSDEHFKVMEKYVASLANLGQKAVTVIASEIPWSGQFCYRDTAYPSNLFEYNMIRIEKDMDGNLLLDFSAADRYIDLCFRYGINREIEVFGLINIWMCEEEGFGRIVKGFSDGIRIRYLDRRDNCFKYIDTVEDITAYIRAIEGHFRERGLIDKVRLVADEPANIKLYQERINFIARIAPSFKYKAAVCHLEFVRKFAGDIMDFVPVFSEICKEAESVGQLKEMIGGRLCWYVSCCPDIPNTFIKSYLLESHVIGWLTEYMGLDGFLRWNYTVWPENPRERISYRYPMWKAGDTNFVYPSNHGGPLLSLRYKALLRGIQNYELLQMLKKFNLQAGEIITGAFAKIFKFRKLDEFHPDSRKSIEQLVSLKYMDYLDALLSILSGLEEIKSRHN